MFDRQVHLITGEVANSLTSRGWRLVTAESCTGGWIAKCCTDLAGSSAWFERGFVTYSNDAKVDLLGVESEQLNREGAVSRTVAEAMATGARSRARVECAVSVTGIAGPDGGSPDKPVGTVWFAWSVGDFGVHSERCEFLGDRNQIRQQTVIHALGVLQSLLNEE